MAILLRAANPDNPIPTRLVEGFLPSDPVGGVVTITARAAHAWVEVYFPGYGWIPFDPTGGNIGTEPSEIQPGPSFKAPPSSPGIDTAEAATRSAPAFGLARRSARRPASGSSQIGNRAVLAILAVLLALSSAASRSPPGSADHAAR